MTREGIILVSQVSLLGALPTDILNAQLHSYRFSHLVFFTNHRLPIRGWTRSFGIASSSPSPHRQKFQSNFRIMWPRRYVLATSFSFEVAQASEMSQLQYGLSPELTFVIPLELHRPRWLGVLSPSFLQCVLAVRNADTEYDHGSLYRRPLFIVLDRTNPCRRFTAPTVYGGTHDLLLKWSGVGACSAYVLRRSPDSTVRRYLFSLSRKVS